MVSSAGCIGRAGRSPSVRSRVVFRSSIQLNSSNVFTTPYDRLSARPYCRLTVSSFGGIHSGSREPGIVVAAEGN